MARVGEPTRSSVGNSTSADPEGTVETLLHIADAYFDAWIELVIGLVDRLASYLGDRDFWFPPD